jgi:hypothetical protein
MGKEIPPALALCNGRAGKHDTWPQPWSSHTGPFLQSFFGMLRAEPLRDITAAKVCRPAFLCLHDIYRPAAGCCHQAGRCSTSYNTRNRACMSGRLLGTSTSRRVRNRHLLRGNRRWPCGENPGRWSDCPAWNHPTSWNACEKAHVTSAPSIRNGVFLFRKQKRHPKVTFCLAMSPLNRDFELTPNC